MKTRLLVALLSALPLAAAAQTLTGVTLDRAEIQAGESVRITAAMDVAGNINCGLRVHFGDGTTQDFKINQDKDVPLVVNRVYAKPGNYEIKIEPKRNGMLLRCSGDNKTISVVVKGAAATTADAGPACPDGWKLDRKSVNRKTGAFTCGAKAGTPLPAARLSCPGSLGYFENGKKGQLGCRP